MKRNWQGTESDFGLISFGGTSTVERPITSTVLIIRLDLIYKSRLWRATLISQSNKSVIVTIDIALEFSKLLYQPRIYCTSKYMLHLAY